MGRLKKDHSGWKTSGLYMKYQQPAIKEKPVKQKSKKDTNKWCKGKVGREHDLIRVFYHTYDNGRYFDYDYWNGRLFYLTIGMCKTCGKTFWGNKAKSMPLIIPVRSHSLSVPVQVKINGRALPFEYHERHGDYCEYHEEWEG